MSNRNYDQFQQTLIRGLVSLFAYVKFNGAGAPTLADIKILQNNQVVSFVTAPTGGAKGGSLSLLRNGVGDYTLTLQDKYVAVLAASMTFLSNSNAASPIIQIKVASNPNAAGSSTGQGWTGASGSPSLNAIEFLTFSAQGTSADPGAGELGILSLQLMNGTAN